MKNPFDRYKGKKTNYKDLKKIEGSKVSELLSEYDSFLKGEIKLGSFLDVDTSLKGFSETKSRLSDIDYTSEDVEKFALYMDTFEGERYSWWKGGVFLTALVNHMEGDSATLDLTGMDGKLSHLGYRLSGKTMKIKGDVGNCLGMEMKSGKIQVYGNCDNITGHLSSLGSIIDVMGHCKSVSDEFGANIRIRRLDKSEYDYEESV